MSNPYTLAETVSHNLSFSLYPMSDWWLLLYSMDADALSKLCTEYYKNGATDQFEIQSWYHIWTYPGYAIRHISLSRDTVEVYSGAGTEQNNEVDMSTIEATESLSVVNALMGLPDPDNVFAAAPTEDLVHTNYTTDGGSVMSFATEENINASAGAGSLTGYVDAANRTAITTGNYALPMNLTVRITGPDLQIADINKVRITCTRIICKCDPPRKLAMTLPLHPTVGVYGALPIC